MPGALKRFLFHSVPLAAFLLLAAAGLAPDAAAACVGDPWQNDLVYTRGALVSHANHEWQAKRTVVVGVAPGTHKPSWQDLGACAGEPLPGGDDTSTGGGTPTPVQIFGVWHAGDHYADWANKIDMVRFAADNQWIVDRGDGVPSVNLVVLSFLKPTDVLDMVPGHPESGVPLGMTQEVVDYFKSAGIRVMMSIGGVTYTDYWDAAMATEDDATKLGSNAAAIAAEFGVGIEIDYERNTDANLEGLQQFIDAYRKVHPYDPDGTNHAARLTMDLAAGGRYLQELNRHATANWLDADPETRQLDYVNAMVHRSSGTPDNWQEHVDGMPTYNPVIPPKAPQSFTGGLYLKGNMTNCYDFDNSEQRRWIDYVETVAPNGAGETNGMLGYMFWAAGTPSARKNYVPTYPPDSCDGGMGIAAIEFDIPIPMEPLNLW